MKILVLVIAASAVVLSPFFLSPANAAGNGAAVTDTCPAASCDFLFWDGNATLTTFKVVDYHDVVAPNGHETETFTGKVANDTGHAVLYTTDSGFPVPAAQTCYSFVTENTTPDWQLTISASGHYSLACHFSIHPSRHQG